MLCVKKRNEPVKTQIKHEENNGGIKIRIIVKTSLPLVVAGWQPVSWDMSKRWCSLEIQMMGKSPAWDACENLQRAMAIRGKPQHNITFKARRRRLVNLFAMVSRHDANRSS